MMMAADGWYIYTGGEAIIPLGVTRVRIHESLTVIPAEAFHGNPSIEEVECHDRVKTVEKLAFRWCRSLRRVIMPGVRAVEERAFADCHALAIVECNKLARIRESAFSGCESLMSINLPSAKIVGRSAFYKGTALTNVKFGKELESIGEYAFYRCISLEQITIPLKDGIITYNNTFRGCEKLTHVDLVEEAVLRDTIDALQLEEWKNDMKEKIGAINLSLPTVPAGNDFNFNDVGGKARAIRMWIRSVRRKIIDYRAQHRRLLNEAATTLQLALPNDIVLENVLPFLELPAYTFEGED